MYRPSQPREVLYEIWEEAEPDKNYKEENTMTNAELAKQIKELNERLDRYHDNQESLFRIRDEETEKLTKEITERLGKYRIEQEETINKCDDKIVHLHNELEELAERVNGLGIVAQETTRQLKEQVDRLDRYRDVLDKQFATYDSKIKQLETAQMQLRLNISSISCVYGIPEESKTIESMYPCLWACVHRGKECNGLAQECPIAEHFSKELTEERSIRNSWQSAKRLWKNLPQASIATEIKYTENDILYADKIKPIWFDNAVEKMTRPILFQKFNAGKMAIVFDGSDPRFEATYMDFWRAFDEWCRTSEKDDKLYPQSSWVTRGYRMNPLMKCPSIYKDRSSFAIWTEWDDEEKNEPTFEYGTLMTDWREHKTVGGLPYTVWRV